MRKRGGDGARSADDSSVRRGTSLGEDPLVHVRAGIENALTHRLAPKTAERLQARATSAGSIAA
jgi:hypothetical protein